MPSLVATREGLLLDLSMDAVWIHIESALFELFRWAG